MDVWSTPVRPLGTWALVSLLGECALLSKHYQYQMELCVKTTQDLYISQVTYCQLITSFPSVTEKDLLYAANWAVSLLQVTQDFFTGTAI